MIDSHQAAQMRLMSEGTQADLTRVANIPKRGSQMTAFTKALRVLDSDGLRAQGYSWFRISAPADDPEHAYLEAWRAKPEQEGTLNRAAAIPAPFTQTVGDRL